jgi:hypothetical protein
VKVEPENMFSDPTSMATVVVRVVDEIDTMSDEESAALLCAMMRAAWGNSLAQNQ